MAVNCDFADCDVISAPCLLDDLMDDAIIKCDFTFGSTGTFPTKGSPSHESDSGVSEMSEVRSISPLSDGNIDSSELVDFDAFKCDLLDETDDELAQYFGNVNKNKCETITVNMDDFPLSDRNQTCLSLTETCTSPAESPIIDVNLVGDNTDDPDYIPYKIPAPKRRSAYIPPKPAEDICVLNPQSVKKAACDSNLNKVPAVKVVKVVKTPVTSSIDDIGRQVAEAIDNRNKQNAIHAKFNREKKKAYISKLEEDIDSMKMENFALKEMSRKALREKNILREEVDYLKNIIANQSALAGLLQNIGNVENVKLSSSFIHRKRGADLDHDYENSSKRMKTTTTSAGVCLHVDQGSVSLEFCSKCSTMAKSTSDAD